jgi:hypothetical protein
MIGPGPKRDLTFADLVPFTVEPRFRPARRGVVFRPGVVSRRQVLRTTLVVAGGVSAWAIGLLPTSRRARANHDGTSWLIYDAGAPQPCDGLGPWVDNDSCDGCNNPRIYCCCNNNGFHIHNGTTMKHRHNHCEMGTPYDGWFWRQVPCCGNGKAYQKWRCTDGWVCQDDDNSCTGGNCDDPPDLCPENQFVKSICKDRVYFEDCPKT